jgi:hypothetical protein
MANPAFIDLALYLPAGGVNGFEVNGHAVNGAGFVDSPFAGIVFALDPYRSILTGVGNTSDVFPVMPSVAPPELTVVCERSEDRETPIPANRNQAELSSDRVSSEVETEMVSAEPEVSNISYVRAEYRTVVIPAGWGSDVFSTRTVSVEANVENSRGPDETETSYVRRENRAVKIPRGDT